MKRRLIALCALSFLLCTILPAYGENGGESESTILMESTGSPYPPAPAQPPAGEVMIVDLLLVRPISFIALVLGTGVSLLATPFALASGSTGPVYERLVVEPYEFTLCRPLGAF